MTRAKGALAVVTGASAGIGVELAKLAAADGYTPVLVARRRERLDALASELAARHSVSPRVVPLDLAEPDAPERLREAVGDQPVEILMNNAGFGTWGRFAGIPLERTTELLRVNVEAPTRLSRLLLDGMLARGRGFILNVASTAAFQPGPGMAAYYASKAYLLSLSEALREELKGTGVRVTALCPGPTRSEFHDVAKMRDSRLVQRLWFMDAEEVARLGYRGMLAGRSVIVPGFMNRALAALPRFVPRAAVPPIVAAIQAPRSL